MDPKKLLLTLLSLPDDASDADIESACKTFADKGKTEEGKPATEDVTAMNVKIDGLVATVAALSKSNEERDRGTLIEQAVREGKLVPLNAAKTMPLDTLKTLLAELKPDQVPVTQRTPENVQAFSVAAPSTAEDQVRKALGISEDAWKKHNAA